MHTCTDENEASIGANGGIPPILAAAKLDHMELQAQCARALRNLSVLAANQSVIREEGGVAVLQGLEGSRVDRVRTQASKALLNLKAAADAAAASAGTGSTDGGDASKPKPDVEDGVVQAPTVGPLDERIGGPGEGGAGGGIETGAAAGGGS